MLKVAVFAAVVLAAPSIGLAQTKISGTTQCGKPDPQHLVQAGDQPNHTFAIMKFKCTWPKPLEIAGFQTKEDELTLFEEANGSAGADRTSVVSIYVVGTMSNGDKVFLRSQGKGAAHSSAGTWTYVGGTGKFKGLTGKGTYKGDGTTTVVEGEYQLGK